MKTKPSHTRTKKIVVDWEVPKAATNPPTHADLATAAIEGLSLGHFNLRCALRDLLAYWDRKDNSGWTAADVKRLAEIRNLAK